MIRRPPRSTLDRSSAASDVYKRQVHATDLADLFCRLSRRKVNRLFRELWSNDDARLNRIAGRVLAGEETWLEKGILDIGLTPDAFKTRSILSQKRGGEDRARVTA